MNKFIAIACLALFPTLGFAQYATTKEAGPPSITKVIRIRYVNAKTVAELVGPGSRAFVVGDNGLKAVVVKGQPADVAMAEQAIKELDVAPAGESAKDVEVTVYVLGATNKSQSSSPAPKEIQPVIKQLESIFPYGSYQLLDTVLIRSREGKNAATTGVMKNFPGPADSPSNGYMVAYSVPARLSEGPERLIRLDNFHFSTHGVDIHTDLDVREGQKVVVGNSNVEGGDSALFVVVSAKVLE